MAFGQYKDFGVKDFLADQEFANAVASGGENADLFIRTLKTALPAKAADIDMAVEILTAYKKQKPYDASARKDLVWQRIENAVQKEHRQAERIVHLSRSRFLRIAALFAVVFSTGITGWFFLSQKEVVTTKGQIARVVLPDESVVTLNGNSKLTYRRAWLPGHVREVWVKGEALFEVKHLNIDEKNIRTSEKFIVHGSHLNVEVLGTVFNVKDRNGKTDVDLLSGKVKVDYKTGPKLQALVMKPGETVRFQPDTQRPKRSVREAKYVSAWTHKQLLFQDASLTDITETLENSYGYQVQIAADDLRDLRIEGTINVPDVDQLLETVSSSLNLEISREKNTIQIDRKH